VRWFDLSEDIALLCASAFNTGIHVRICSFVSNEDSLSIFCCTGKKDFVILTKSFVKIGITKTFSYNNKMFSSVN